MNCKPGDIAICVSTNPVYRGHMFEVIELAPATRFTLPNGVRHEAPKDHRSWVLKSLSGGAPYPYDPSKPRVIFGVGIDRALRPLRGIPDDADVISEASCR